MMHMDPQAGWDSIELSRICCKVEACRRLVLCPTAWWPVKCLGGEATGRV
jgi:hypothetical protein